MAIPYLLARQSYIKILALNLAHLEFLGSLFLESFLCVLLGFKEVR